MTGLLQTLAVGILIWVVIRIAINVLLGDDDGRR